MGSSRRPVRSRYFGFSGKPPGRDTEAATTDEILDSLTRQAKLMAKDGDERTLGLQTMLEDDPGEDPLQSSRLAPNTLIEGLKNGNFGKLAYPLMFVGGLTLLWIYSRLSQSVSPERLAEIQQTILRAGFADWQKIALIAICALAVVLLTRRSKGRMRSRVISTV